MDREDDSCVEEEIEALRHIYGESDCQWEPAARRVSVRLNDQGLFGSGVWLIFALPRSYPRGAPEVEVTSLGARLDDEREALVVAAREAIAAADATMYDCVVAANDLLGDLADERATPEPEALLPTVAVAASSPRLLKRKLVYSHHIIADAKRAGLRELSVALNVTTLCKIGWPGVLVLEGDAASVEVYVAVIQKWRWKHLVVRGEQEIDAMPTLDSVRALPKAFVEFGPNQMSDLARTCREAGLDDLFRRVFK